MNDNFDQTNFYGNQQAYTPERVEEPVPTPVIDENAQTNEPKKPPLMLYLGIGFLIVFIAVVLVVVSLQMGKSDSGSTPEPTPTSLILPTNPPVEDSELRKKIDAIQDQVEEIDPSNVPLDPPPINYSISL